MDVDEDALIATLDLAGRTGATGLQFGYLHDDVPVNQADWWAYAQYRGARISVEHHAGPIEALEALARRLLAGAQCKCGRKVTLSDSDAGKCRWRRVGRRWHRGCENRKERRSAKRKKRG